MPSDVLWSVLWTLSEEKREKHGESNFFRVITTEDIELLWTPVWLLLGGTTA